MAPVIAYMSTIHAKAGRRADLLALLAELVEAAERDEPGTLAYTFHTLDDEPDTVISYELFADDAALARGVNVVDGKLTYEAVAEAHGLSYTPLEDVLPLAAV